MTPSSSATDATYELVFKRTFDAPRELVWRAWNDPEHARQWGPKGFTTPEREMDLRPGGAWHALMISPDGTHYRQHGVVQEIVAPERLSFHIHLGRRSRAGDAGDGHLRGARRKDRNDFPPNRAAVGRLS